MAQTANVRSVDALKAFKIALINFAEDARVALSSAEMELNQARNWLERDQLAYWKSQVKRSHEALAQAKSDLFRRRLSQSNSDAISDTEQKEAVRDAQKRLRHAEEMVEKVKRWVPILQHATTEYHMQSQPLGDTLSGSLAGSIATLERMIAALESYLALTVPEAPLIPPSGGSSEGTTTGSAASARASGEVPETAEAGSTTPGDEAPAAAEEAEGSSEARDASSDQPVAAEATAEER